MWPSRNTETLMTHVQPYAFNVLLISIIMCVYIIYICVIVGQVDCVTWFPGMTDRYSPMAWGVSEGMATRVGRQYVNSCSAHMCLAQTEYTSTPTFEHTHGDDAHVHQVARGGSFRELPHCRKLCLSVWNREWFCA